MTESILQVKKSCGGYGKVMAIFPEGNIYMCQCLENENFRIGNIQVDTSETIGQTLLEMLEKDEIKTALKEKYPDIKIIILTTFDDDEFVFSALKYGASGYLLKGVSMDELYHAICTVYNGGAMINPDIATKVFKLFSKMSMSNYAIQVDDSLSKDLTQAELKVIQQVGFGLSNKEIAQKLYLSEGTVRNYVSIVLSKLELRDRTQLAIWAVQTGVTMQEFGDDND